MAQEELVVHGAREHNLKDITVRLPRNALICITGLSGSPASPRSLSTPSMRKVSAATSSRSPNRAQTVTFTKTIYAPGVPSEGTLFLALGFGRSLGKIITSGSVSVNGIQIHGRLNKVKNGIGPSSFDGPLDARARAAFRYGANKLTIRAVKAPTKKGERCHDKNGRSASGQTSICAS